MESKKQYGAIDIAKYVSALLVVAIHTYPFWEVSETFNTFFIAVVCRLAVPFFFVTSAFFFFGKVRRENMDAENRLYIYLRRLLILYLVWTVLYIPYTVWNYVSAGVTWLSPLAWLRDFFLNGSYYHLWFLPALILGTCMVYRLWLKHGLKTAFMVSLILYLLGYMINVFAPFWMVLPGFDVAYSIFEKTLVTARDGIFFAPVFVCIGLIAAKVRPLRQGLSAAGLVISMLCLILEVFLYWKLDILSSQTCMFLSLVPAVYFLFELLIKIRIPWKPFYRQLRKESTLIYVSHILFARILLLLLPDAHLIVYLLTLFFSQLFCTLILRFERQIPLLKYLM